MTTTTAESGTFTSLEKSLVQIVSVLERMREKLKRLPSQSELVIAYNNDINELNNILEKLSKQTNSLEGERRNLSELAQTNQVINSTLDLDQVLQIVMDTIIHLTGAERGFLMLRDEEGKIKMRVARDWEQETLDESEFAISTTVINRVIKEGQPVLTTNAQEDPRFTGGQSVVAYNLRSILCVALKVKDEVIGVIYADNRIRSGLFKQKDLDLLFAFANQAAIAIDNARLFASVKNTLAEVTDLKNLMSNVFESMASGVFTQDLNESVMMCNKAAEAILGWASKEMIGRKIGPPLSDILEPHLERVMKTDQAIIGLEVNPTIPDRGELDLRFSLSPLKNVEHSTQGVAIVMEDLTERKKLEASRRMFERMVSPAVIKHLDPNSLKLGGIRQEITTLFADIRGFTTFSEKVSPEELVSILNRHLAAAAEAVLFEDGTIDKFLGDAVMAWFNAPVPQPDHTLRAVRAALAIRSDLQALHLNLPPERRLSFGVGIHMGDAVLGLVGTEKMLNFTAVGDSVNTAKRIQENAGPGQILISREALNRVVDAVVVERIGEMTVKGKQIPVEVYKILRLR